MKTVVRLSLWMASGLLAVVALALGLDAGGGRALWPWPDGRLSYIFICSILLAEATVLAWQAWTLDLHAAKGGARGFLGMNSGLALLMASRFRSDGEAMALVWALVCAALALGSAWILVLARQYPPVDRGPTPRVVRWSFLVFAAALFVATAMLLARMPVVFPWPLKPQSSLAFGFLFLASAVYFLDGFLRPSWSNAIGQLLGFLVYDLVLFVPWIQHLAKAEGGFLVSLLIYLLVLTWSALLAVYYLVIHRRTRIMSALDFAH